MSAPQPHLPRALLAVAAVMTLMSMPTCFATSHVGYALGETAQRWGDAGWAMLPLATILGGLVPLVAVYLGVRARSKYMNAGGEEALIEGAQTPSSMTATGILVAGGRWRLALLWLLILSASLVLVTATVVASVMFASGLQATS